MIEQQLEDVNSEIHGTNVKTDAADVKREHRSLSRIQIIEDSDDDESANEKEIHEKTFNRIEIMEDSEDEEGVEESSMRTGKATIIQEFENKEDEDEASRENVSTTSSTTQIVEDKRDDEEIPDVNTDVGEDLLLNDASSDAIITSWNEKFVMNPKPSAYEFMTNCAGAAPESLMTYVQTIEEKTLKNMFTSTIDESTFDILLTHLPSRLAA